MSASETSGPLLTIGMPIYNGESHLRHALDALLAQDFTDFVIHICDNGSTDRTPEMCQEYAAADARVQYHRNETNLGPVQNFNRAFSYCQTLYFMFASDDDIREPDFLSRCISALQRDPQAILAFTYFDTIEPDGSRGPMIDDRLETVGLDQRARLRYVLRHIAWCSAIYGVIRADALARTRLFRNILAFDVAVLTELALFGSFVKVREVLYHRQMVPEVQWSRRRQWERFDPANKQRRYFLPRFWMLREIVCQIAMLDAPLLRKLLLVADTLVGLGVYPVIRFTQHQLRHRSNLRTRATE